jgi:hypothetical protein
MPNAKDKSIEVNYLPYLIAIPGIFLILRKYVDTAALDHHTVYLLFIDRLIDYLKLCYVIFVSLAIEWGCDVDKYPHSAAGVLVVVKLALLCCFEEGVERWSFF